MADDTECAVCGRITQTTHSRIRDIGMTAKGTIFNILYSNIIIIYKLNLIQFIIVTVLTRNTIYVYM